MMEMNDMTSTKHNMTSRIFWVAVVTCLLLFPLLLGAQTKSQAAAPAQKSFATPQEAVDALISAASDYNVSSLLEILGPDGKDLVETKDPVQDKNQAEAFAALARKKNSVSINQKNPNLATLIVGEHDWPSPIPLLKKNGKWLFDSKTGRMEVLYRRIGTNELDAIQICRGFVEAQLAYASSIHDDSGVNQYAQKILSTPGKQDGLYWENPDGTPGGPISKAIAKAIAEGYSTDKRSAYHGYYFKVLKGQGPAAPLGKLDYVIQGAMIGGFALLAVPSEYRVNGVKSFIVNQDGVVFQKDLGPNSVEIGKQLELYNPDKTWQVTDDNWPESVAPDTGVAE
jgi:hypothetical protein